MYLGFDVVAEGSLRTFRSRPEIAEIDLLFLQEKGVATNAHGAIEGELQPSKHRMNVCVHAAGYYC